MQPKDPFLLYAMGLELIGESDYANAESWLEQCLQSDESYLAAYYQLGQTKVQLEKETEAVGIYEAGMELAKTQKQDRTFNELQSALEALKV